MEEKEYKKKIRHFWHRLKIEALVRAGSIGLAAGFTVAAAILFYGRIRYQKLIFTEAVPVAVVILLAVMFLGYFLVFRPKKKTVLARIDSLGLKERIVTMEELKKEDTVIAKAQRQDAQSHLNGLPARRLKLRMYIVPFLYCAVMAVLITVLILVPIPEPEADPVAEKNAQEMALVDELITALKDLVIKSDVKEESKTELKEIIDALAVSFTPEDSTLTRTAKIATASKRLDMYEAEKQSELTLLKQQLDGSEEMKLQVTEENEEQFRLSRTVKKMKDLMGTSIEVLNMVEGTFWTPGGPGSGTSYDVEELPPEEQPEGEEPPEGEQGELPPEGMEPGENGEPQEGMEGEWNGGIGSELIFDPEQGEVSYGVVYEEYYQAILKALTEQEYSEDIRKFIEDYANSLE